MALNYSRYTDDAWGAAGTVSESEDMFVNWADLPSVVPLADGHLAAHWMVEDQNLRLLQHLEVIV